MSTYVGADYQRIKFLSHRTEPEDQDAESRVMQAKLMDGNVKVAITGRGTGPIDSFVDAVFQHYGIRLSVKDYAEHSLQHGSDAAAICYMQMEHNGKSVFGVGINKNIVAASLEAIVSVVNRLRLNTQS